jgi:hypothetical protein
MNFYSQALFIYDTKASDWIDPVRDNPFEVSITSCALELFVQEPLQYIKPGEHIIIVAETRAIEACLHIAMEYDLSVGYLPFATQKTLIRYYGLSAKFEENLQTALSSSDERVDLVLCGDKLMQVKAEFGEIPLISVMNEQESLAGYLRNLKMGIKQFFKIMMQQVSITTSNEKKVQTVVSGISLLQSSRSGFFFQTFRYQ